MNTADTITASVLGVLLVLLFVLLLVGAVYGCLRLRRSRRAAGGTRASSETVVEAGSAVGVRNESDAEYRLRQLAVLDTWIIERWQDNTSGEPSFVPRPLWDEEAALTRNGFDTEEQARDYVVSVGGTLHSSMR